MKLFYTPTSPYARKARILVRELDLMERVEEVVAYPYDDDPELLAVNPVGLVPTLVTDDGVNLIDSPVVCRFLTDFGDRPQTEADRWAVLSLEALADSMMDQGLVVRAERTRADSERSEALIERKFSKLQRCVDAIPVQTAPTDASPHVGQIALACALSYLDFRMPEWDWRSRRPDVAAWHAAIEKRPAFQETRP